MIGPIAEPGYNFPSLISRKLKFNQIDEREFDNFKRVKREIFDQKFSNINNKLKEKLQSNFIDPSNALCDKNYCYYANLDGSFFSDSNHLSSYGVGIVEKEFSILNKNKN